MPKELFPDLDERILAEASARPAGISLAALARKLGKRVSRRSLQRRLAALTREGVLAREGATRAQRYRIAAPARAPEAVEAALERVPVSAAAERLRALVRLPVAQRRPVGYDRAFLDEYRPNETFYLADAAWRERLLQIGRTPFAQRAAGTYARDVMNRLLIDLSWASSRLEGNTYTRLDTQNLIEFGRAAEGKDALETQMILNHKHAIEFLIEQAGTVGFDMFTFMNLHALLAEGLLADPGAGGRLRTRAVDVTGTVFHPLAIPQQIEELFRRLLEKAAAVRDPFEQAFFLMVHVPYLQPFEDVNKRVSRLAANIPFIRGNLCPLSFMDVPERAYVEGLLAIYEHKRVELLRDVFVWAYERSCERFRAVTAMLPEPDPFRLEHRAALGEVVAEAVRKRLAADAKTLRRLADGLVPAEDLGRFAKLALEELRHLHEGNIARYRLRLAEFRAWKGHTR